MDQLIQQLRDRVGLDEDKAREAADTAISFIREKLPEPIAGQLDGLLSGGTDAIAGLADKLPGGLGSTLGGMLGGKD